jgi:hypothetical protein
MSEQRTIIRFDSAPSMEIQAAVVTNTLNGADAITSESAEATVQQARAFMESGDITGEEFLAMQFFKITVTIERIDKV